MTYFGGGIRAGGGGAPPLALAFVVVVVVAVDDFSVVLFPADGVAFPPYDIARSLSLFFTRRALPLVSFFVERRKPSLFPFSFFLSLSFSLSRERETNATPPTNAFLYKIFFLPTTQRERRIQLNHETNALSSLSSSSRKKTARAYNRALHTKHQHHRKKKCRRRRRRVALTLWEQHFYTALLKSGWVV